MEQENLTDKMPMPENKDMNYFLPLLASRTQFNLPHSNIGQGFDVKNNRKTNH